jgi:hypothetical protein
VLLSKISISYKFPRARISLTLAEYYYRTERRLAGSARRTCVVRDGQGLGNGIGSEGVWRATVFGALSDLACTSHQEQAGRDYTYRS